MAKTDQKDPKTKKTEDPKTAAPEKVAKTEKNMAPSLFKEKAYETIISLTKGNAQKVDVMTKGFDSPEKITFGGFNAKSYQPEAVAHYDGYSDVYALEGESSKKAIAKNLGKWILFSLEAKKSRGTFYIVTTKACHSAINKIITSKQINVQLITVD